MPVKLEHRIGVQAPAEVIWESLVDVASWPEWTQIYSKAGGIIRIDSQLDLTLALPKRQPREVKATVLDWAPNDHIHWTTRGRFGLSKSLRYLEIEALTETGCIFSNGEIFEGMLGEDHAARNGFAIRSGFALLGEALKERAEAAWQAKQKATK
ncbi:MAG TPA: SRPBCC domain-containing protein [Caulobacteraceae bacterium]